MTRLARQIAATHRELDRSDVPTGCVLVVDDFRQARESIADVLRSRSSGRVLRQRQRGARALGR